MTGDARVLKADVMTGPLSPDEPDPSDVVSGTPSMSSEVLMAAAGVEVGIWQLTEGSVTDTEADEVFIVLAGRATVSFEDGSVLPLSPGAAVHLRAGERTTWVVTETLRKIYVLTPDQAVSSPDQT